jgi:hypothetical protein
MFLLSPSYLALVSFVAGCDAATAGSLLDGFDAWVARRTPQVGKTSFGWASVIAARHWPPAIDGVHTIAELPADADALAGEDLLGLLDEFLEERTAP